MYYLILVKDIDNELTLSQIEEALFAETQADGFPPSKQSTSTQPSPKEDVTLIEKENASNKSCENPDKCVMCESKTQDEGFAGDYTAKKIGNTATIIGEEQPTSSQGKLSRVKVNSNVMTPNNSFIHLSRRVSGHCCFRRV